MRRAVFQACPARDADLGKELMSLNLQHHHIYQQTDIQVHVTTRVKGSFTMSFQQSGTHQDDCAPCSSWLSEFPRGLPQGTPHIEYSSMEELQEQIESQALSCSKNNSESPFLLVSKVPTTILEIFDHTYPDRGPLIATNLQSRLLIVEVMASTPHDTLARRFDYVVSRNIESIGLDSELIASGSSRATSSDGKFVKEADAAWVLSSNTEWPVIVLETGLSEAENKLAIDAQGWLEAASSKTKVVVTAKIHRDRPIIVFKLWQRHDVARRLSSHYIMAANTQRAEVAYVNGATTASGRLEIPLAEVFPDRYLNHHQKSVVIEAHNLQDIAERVWKTQHFLHV